MTDLHLDPFAGSTSAPSLSFRDAPLGTSYTGTVLEAPSLVQSRDFETEQPAFWPDGNPKMSAVVRLQVGGEERSLWAQKPSAMFKAVGEAQAKLGRPMRPGDTLTVTFSGEKPNNNPKLHAQKLYTVELVPGDVFADQAAPAAPPAGAPAAVTQSAPAAQQAGFVPPAAGGVDSTTLQQAMAMLAAQQQAQAAQEPPF